MKRDFFKIKYVNVISKSKCERNVKKYWKAKFLHESDGFSLPGKVFNNCHISLIRKVRDTSCYVKSKLIRTTLVNPKR